MMMMMMMMMMMTMTRIHGGTRTTTRVVVHGSSVV